MTSRDGSDIPEDLLEPPTGDVPPPPIETLEQDLPFDRLRWEDFEKLTLRLARLEGTVLDSRRYGVPGQAQYGIDWVRLF